MLAISYQDNPPLENDALNALFGRAWPQHEPRDFGPILARSLVYVAAFDGGRLVGFVNVATDGGAHAFLLDPTVDPDYQRRRIGTGLVERAVKGAAAKGCEWLHVDFKQSFGSFYSATGFEPTAAGLMRLTPG